MRILLAILILVSSVSVLAQRSSDTSATPLFRLSLSTGLSSSSADQENMDERLTKNESRKGSSTADQFTQRSELLRPQQEMMLTFSTRPLVDNKLLILRFGRMTGQYRFTTVAQQTGGGSGSLSLESREEYIVYPISIGAGIASPGQFLQLQGEFIYAFAGMTEEQTIIAEDGTRSPLSTLSSRANTIGFCLAVHVNIPITGFLAVTVEGGYRGLEFYNFTDRRTGAETGLEYSASQGFINGGLSFGW